MKTSGVLGSADPNPSVASVISVYPVMGMPMIETSVVKPVVGSVSRKAFAILLCNRGEGKVGMADLWQDKIEAPDSRLSVSGSHHG